MKLRRFLLVPSMNCLLRVCLLYRLMRRFFSTEQDWDEWSIDAEDEELSPAYKWCHWGPISATFVVIIIGLSTSIVHASWWDITTLGGMLDLMVFLFWNYLVIRNLYLSCMLGSGYIKIGWHPEDSEEWQYFRYCYRCFGFKLPRAHHCSRCKRCVMLMDHHCPWVNNCIGQRNRIYFIKFLFFAVVGSVHAAIVLTSCLYKIIFFVMSNNSQPYHFHQTPKLPFTSIYLFISSVLATGLAYGVIIAVGVLLIIQLRSLYLDRTGIESLYKQN